MRGLNEAKQHLIALSYFSQIVSELPFLFLEVVFHPI